MGYGPLHDLFHRASRWASRPLSWRCLWTSQWQPRAAARRPPPWAARAAVTTVMTSCMWRATAGSWGRSGRPGLRGVLAALQRPCQHGAKGWAHGVKDVTVRVGCTNARNREVGVTHAVNRPVVRSGAAEVDSWGCHRSAHNATSLVATRLAPLLLNSLHGQRAVAFLSHGVNPRVHQGGPCSPGLHTWSRPGQAH